MNSFYTSEELRSIGFQSVGENVQVSRKCSIYQADKISLGNHVRIDDFTVLSGGSGIEIGSYVHIACFCGLFGGGGIRIGDFSGLSSRCVIYSVSDDFSGATLIGPVVPAKYRGVVCKPVNIEDHVIIGTNSTVLPGVTIHEGVAIGAHSLIRNSCDRWSIYYGSPAKKIKSRNQTAKELGDHLLSGIRTESTHSY
ncbi:acyltransferase [soil metagenome]